ncbi:ShlB/FhaC/HecB family hemolysin secretion/activation protein, partial [Enterobacteriaceae bacterium YMB-R21]|nr:ShlB/FhaC/HecB family hemolysin secretion/activation protein [Tenebrionicola larvae]
MKICRTAAFVLAGAFTGTASAAPLSPADRDTIRQQQQHLLEQSQQQRDELERATPLARPPQPAPEVSTPGP